MHMLLLCASTRLAYLLFLRFLLFVVGIHSLVAAGVRRARAAAVSSRALVNGFSNLHSSLAEGLSGRFNSLGIFSFHCSLESSEGLLNSLLGLLVELVLVLFEALFALVERGFRVVFDLDQILASGVGLGVSFGVADHLFDLSIAKSSRGLDSNVLLLACALILCGNIHDSISIDIKDHFDLRRTARGGGDVGEFEVAEKLVVGGHLSFSLKNFDAHNRLVVRRRREDLRLFGRDGGVAVDESGEDSAEGLDT
mmetsp:Transcript_8803/g.16190  ORF Transcript_8803/g.16190 Transcript_8803/m.16190 type:complete len:253 (+) Transcript_8803:344-1102(+)